MGERRNTLKGNDHRIEMSMGWLAFLSTTSSSDTSFFSPFPGKCYYRLGLFREAEQQFKSASKQQNMLDTVLLLSKVYVRLDQPLTAVDVYNEVNFRVELTNTYIIDSDRQILESLAQAGHGHALVSSDFRLNQGLETFPNDVNLLTGIARIYEGIQDLDLSVNHYKLVLQQVRLKICLLLKMACCSLPSLRSFGQPIRGFTLRMLRTLRPLPLWEPTIFTRTSQKFRSDSFDVSCKWVSTTQARVRVCVCVCVCARANAPSIE